MLNLKQEHVFKMNKKSKQSNIKKHKIRKRIRITEQCSQYVEQDWDTSWFNNGNEEMERYGIRVVDDVSKFLLDGEISDDDQKHSNFLDSTLEIYQKEEREDFNAVKQFKHRLDY